MPDVPVDGLGAAHPAGREARPLTLADVLARFPQTIRERADFAACGFNDSHGLMGAAQQGNAAAGRPAGRSRRSSRWWLLVAALVFLTANYWLGSRATQTPSRVRVPYSPFFVQQVEAGNVTEITSKGTAIQGTFKQAERLRRLEGDHALRRPRSPRSPTATRSRRSLQSKQVVVNAQPLQTSLPWWENLLVSFGPTLLFLVLLVWLMRRAERARRTSSAPFSRSSARRYAPGGDRVTFADVAGIDEAKAELAEVVDFLREPEQVPAPRRPHPARRPPQRPAGHRQDAARSRRRGRGECVPFFSMSASEFVEAIVGVGAARVRDLFKKAKKAAPAIVFIDELDAVGGSRVSGEGGLQRRQRRARADAEPDPDRDGRLRLARPA